MKLVSDKQRKKALKWRIIEEITVNLSNWLLMGKEKKLYNGELYRKSLSA